MLTVAITIGGGSVSSLMTETCSTLSHETSNLHQDTLARTFSGALICNQQGPLIFLSNRKFSKEVVLVPNVCVNVVYFFPVGGGGNDA